MASAEGAAEGAALANEASLQQRDVPELHCSLTIASRGVASQPTTGPVQVGWMLSEPLSSIIFGAPERVRSAPPNRAHAKSASRCPAVVGLESRYFSVPCPFDLSLGFSRDDEGKPMLKNLLGNRSPVRASKLAQHLHLVDEREWRYPDRPTLQLELPYLFVADEPLWLSQVSPFLHYRPSPLPGTIFGGRFPIHVWPRPLMWAFEWHDTSRALELKRGEPLFYVQFETLPQERSVQLVEASHTPELQEYLDMISGAVNYVNQTFSLFEAAEARRPPQLLVPRER